VTLLVERLGTVSGDRMRDVCAALQVATDCEGTRADRRDFPAV
jgi:hypothetical protein